MAPGPSRPCTGRQISRSTSPSRFTSEAIGTLMQSMWLASVNLTE